MLKTTVIALALLLILVGGLAVACGNDGGSAPTPEGPTTLSLAKSMTQAGEGEFRFTLELINTGDNAAINVATSDVWEEGLEVTAIGEVEGQQPEDIGDFGLEFVFSEFAAGKRVEVVYTARCVESGEWENTAAASSANSEPAETSVRVSCP